MSADKDPPLEVLEGLTALGEARREYDDAKAANDVTERRLTAATNALNQAQKKLDKAFDRLRIDAPWHTDWHAERRRKCEAP